jgi:hypothetical protein
MNMSRCVDREQIATRSIGICRPNLRATQRHSHSVERISISCNFARDDMLIEDRGEICSLISAWWRSHLRSTSGSFYANNINTRIWQTLESHNLGMDESIFNFLLRPWLIVLRRKHVKRIKDGPIIALLTI